MKKNGLRAQSLWVVKILFNVKITDFKWHWNGGSADLQSIETSFSAVILTE